jgi:hypothetical protein
MSAAAAITIINLYDHNFNDQDLSNISIPYADLTGGSF